MDRLVLAVDPGQRVDPSAIILTEEVLAERAPAQWSIRSREPVFDGNNVVSIAGRREPSRFVVRHMERMHHGPYRAIAKRVARIASNTRQLAPKSGLVVAIDATGLGRPFAETVTEELRLAGVRCGAGNVVLTAGEKLTCSLGDAEIQLSKSVLVSSLTALFEARRIKLPRDHPEAEAMLQELLGFQIRVSPSGQDTYESRVGAHDDLVIASGMATIGQWRRPTVVRGFG